MAPVQGGADEDLQEVLADLVGAGGGGAVYLHGQSQHLLQDQHYPAGGVREHKVRRQQQQKPAKNNVVLVNIQAVRQGTHPQG